MKTFVLSLLFVLCVSSVTMAGPLGKVVAKPTVSITVTPPTIKTGETVTVTWTSTGGKKAILAIATVSGQTSTEKVDVNGTKTFTPTESTAYRIYVKKGFRTVNALSGVDVTK
jgi:TusA-related sulfurtransferase